MVDETESISFRFVVNVVNKNYDLAEHSSRTYKNAPAAFAIRNTDVEHGICRKPTGFSVETD